VNTSSQKSVSEKIVSQKTSSETSNEGVSSAKKVTLTEKDTRPLVQRWIEKGVQKELYTDKDGAIVKVESDVKPSVKTVLTSSEKVENVPPAAGASSSSAKIDLVSKYESLATTSKTETTTASSSKVEPAKTESNKVVSYEVTNQKPASIQFDNTRFDYGTVKQGDKITRTFMFKNTGDQPLEILNAEGSCGCTQPTFPLLPIPPGETGKIMVVFDSKHKEGAQMTTVTVTTNTYPKVTKLELVGNVEKIDGTPNATTTGN
jgi:hypothetical protein